MPRALSGLKDSVYQDSLVELIHGDAFKLLDRLPLDWVGEHLITDPPYAPATHVGARTGGLQKKLVTFASFTEEELGELLAKAAKHVTRWAVFTVDFTHVAYLQKNPIPGWRWVRMGIWIKPGAAPQFTGDRPGQGWEAIAFLHRCEAPGLPDHVRIRWNGGGRDSVFIHPVERGGHPTQKPLPLYGEFIHLFTEPGDMILDPLAGSGTTLVAAKARQRRALGFEREETYVKTAVTRLQQDVLNLGGF